MDPNPDLNAAPREALLAIISQQQNTIAQLQRRIETLEGKAKPGGLRGMPGVKPKSGQRPSRDKGPEKGSRKPRPHGFSRQRMTPTHQVEHVLESCPECGAGLAGGWVQRTREVIDLPVAPAQAAEHVYIARVCPICEQRRMPPADLAGVALGKQRLGVNLLSLMAALCGKRAGCPSAPSTRHPVVSAHRSSTAAKPRRHRRSRSPGGPKGPTGAGTDCGPYPRQPSGPRR